MEKNVIFSEKKGIKNHPFSGILLNEGYLQYYFPEPSYSFNSLVKGF